MEMNSDAQNEKDIKEAVCKACLEPIRSGASICPRCSTRQIRRKWWEYLATSLKWIGGATAILSFIALAVQTNEIYRNYRSRRLAVEEMNTMAEFALSLNDYSGALELTRQVLQISPFDRKAGQLQLDVSMYQIRQISYLNNESWEADILPIIQTMRRGVIRSTSFKEKADLLSHIGWAYFLGDELRQSTNYFKEALTTDPNNVYANTMVGTLCAAGSAHLNGPNTELCGNNPYETIVSLYETAYVQNQEREWVLNKTFSSLFSLADGYVIAYANFLRKLGSDDAKAYSQRILNSIKDFLKNIENGYGKLLAMVTLVELEKLVNQISNDIDDKSYLDDVLMAELTALSGDQAEALKRFRPLRLRVRNEPRDSLWGRSESPDYYIDESIVKSSGVRLGNIGMRFEKNDEAASDIQSSARRWGAIVGEVTPSGAADKAGIQKGDLIIGMNNYIIRNHYHIRWLLDSMLSGEQITLTMRRHGQESKVSLTLQEGEDPFEDLGPGNKRIYKIADRIFYQPVEIYTGQRNSLMLENLSSEFQAGFKIAKDVQGAILLESYYTGSENYFAGDVIVAVIHKKVANVAEVLTALDECINAGMIKIPVTLLTDKGLEDQTIEFNY